ncbi:MAG: TonB-dependent receptor [Pedobacter sp.]|nr:MAG: TonB-dependent receptor [Pedobacter sp.]
MKLKYTLLLASCFKLITFSYAQKVSTDSVVKQDTSRKLNEVVISGSLKEVSRLQSHIPVEVYSKKFFDKNPSFNLFESIQQINGVRPQLNCAICNTGDIHMNGLEGPYTIILVDGMPVMSSLGSVYGMHGIPMGLIERVEVIKGPASITYGSEAMGGVINIITQKNVNVPKFQSEVLYTCYGEANIDAGLKLNIEEKWSVLSGLNYFRYQNKFDQNRDNFTDVTLQNRIAIFLKLDQQRRFNRKHQLMLRYMYEDRWGGEMNWNSNFRGGEEVYGESIYTNRLEWIGRYDIPGVDNLNFNYSYVYHHQNSFYGSNPYIASQQVLFGQLVYHLPFGKLNSTIGAAYKNIYNRDKSLSNFAGNLAYRGQEHQYLPSVFFQSSYDINSEHSLLFGSRLDHHNAHGLIYTPRFSYKWNYKDNGVFRLLFGTGFRVVNVFTEDHAALSGARELVIPEQLKPERSYQINANVLQQVNLFESSFGKVEANIYYTRFSNRILPDLDENANWIVYRNLKGYGFSKGANIALDLSFIASWKLNVGLQYQDIQQVQDGIAKRPYFAEKFSSNLSLGYTFEALKLSVDYTAAIYSPMRLPLLNEMDPRKGMSPWWSLQNLQIKWVSQSGFEVFGGVKNLFNFKPTQGNPFIIARAHDPFDKLVQFDNQGQALQSSENPYGLVFDPGYIYAPNQGRRVFIGLRYHLK